MSISFKPIHFGFALLFLLLYFFFTPFFVQKTLFSVSYGDSVASTSQKLKESGIIRSKTAFSFVTKAFFDDGFVAGVYTISPFDSVITLAYRMAQGDTNTPPVVLTITEGETVFDIATKAKARIPYFSPEVFIELAKGYEGYLFPETYHLNANTTEEELFKAMRSEFDKKTASLKEKAEIQKKKWNDVVIFASLLEKEGKTLSDKRIIAGILYRRMAIGMPLQVDATFLYTHQKGSSEITAEELKEDSPYNTYTRQGLPKGAIANPGLVSFEAALDPLKSSYLYYLTGSDGMMHYADDFETHVRNKQLYLK